MEFQNVAEYRNPPDLDEYASITRRAVSEFCVERVR